MENAKLISNTSCSRGRFLEKMRYATPDRVLYFEEGIRESVLESWRAQGLPPDADLSKMFHTDLRVEIRPELSPHPKPDNWPTSQRDLPDFQKRLDPTDPHRIPPDWPEQVQQMKKQDSVRMLRVHRGFFQSMGVNDWRRFNELIFLLSDDPNFVRQAMMIQGEFAAKIAERVLADIEIDAAIFSDPIGGNHGPLISPRMYEEFVLKSYQPVLNVLKQNGVEVFIFRTYANARLLIPSILKWGINCLWACEVNIQAMDYIDLRRTYGRELRLIGGIDLDVLRSGKDAIRRELERIVPPLLADGGYVPLADGRVREDIPFENYAFYRHFLEQVTNL